MSDNSRHHHTVEEYKIRASLLLKAIRGRDGQQQLEAARRLTVTRRYGDMQPHGIIEQAAGVQRKHCLEAVAKETGFDDWPRLKSWLELQPTDSELFSPQGSSPFLNHWFRNYAEAKAWHRREGGYLLPFRHQCFVCDEDYISFLGLDPRDPGWQAIGFDWLQPAEPQARDRLRTTLLNKKPGS